MNRAGFPSFLRELQPGGRNARAGLGDGVGVAWLDAHGNFNTSETTKSGFLDGTAVAVMTGRCWKAGHRPRIPRIARVTLSALRWR